MRIINFGSLNIDKVYQVEQFVRPGQTITAKDYAVAAGGKGLNQSLAAARAGAEVLHAGAIGAEGRFMADLLRESGADTSLLREVDGPSGHAVIEINAAGQNRIIVFGGANRSMTSEYIERVLDTAQSDDWVLLQNEVNLVPEIICRAHEKGLRVVFNPSPVHREIGADRTAGGFGGIRSRSLAHRRGSLGADSRRSTGISAQARINHRK